MAQDNKGLKKPAPVKSSYVYNIGTGDRNEPATKIIKGGDLRSRPGKNAGR